MSKLTNITLILLIIVFVNCDVINQLNSEGNQKVSLGS